MSCPVLLRPTVYIYLFDINQPSFQKIAIIFAILPSSVHFQDDVFEASKLWHWQLWHRVRKLKYRHFLESRRTGPGLVPSIKDHLSATALISISYKIAHNYDYTTTDFPMIGEMDLLNPFLARGSNLTTAASWLWSVSPKLLQWWIMSLLMEKYPPFNCSNAEKLRPTCKVKVIRYCL